jgi:hypothetical protein
MAPRFTPTKPTILHNTNTNDQPKTKKVRKLRTVIKKYAEVKEYKTSPSIPCIIQRHSIDYTNTKGKDIVGPNHYKPSYDSVCARPKGLGFSRLGIKKENTPKESQPGPGQYSFSLERRMNFNCRV